MRKFSCILSIILLFTMIVSAVPVSAKTSCNYCNPQYNCGCKGDCRGDCNICNRLDYEKAQGEKSGESSGAAGAIAGAGAAIGGAVKGIIDDIKNKDKTEGMGWDNEVPEVSGKDVVESNIKVKMRGYTDKNGKVVKEYKTVEFDVNPQLINNRTMVPIRAVAEELGYEVKWTGNTKRVDIIGSQNEMMEGQLPYQCKTILEMMKNNMKGGKKTSENFGNTYTYFNSTPVNEEIYEKFYNLLKDDCAAKYGVYLHVGKTKGVAYVGRASELSLDEIRVDYEMDVTPIVYKERTLLPLRAVGELLGFDVKWDGSTQTVYIDGN